jgi:phosphomevalonate kinase
MATAKKVAAKAAPKRAPAKKVLVMTKTVAKVNKQQEFSMPMEVKEWIDHAASRIKSLQGKVERLETEIEELKNYKRWATNKIMGTSYE